jgi:phage virion morphogenesis protein
MSRDDIDKFVRSLTGLVGGVDLTPLYQEIGEIMLASIDRNFREGGRFGTQDADGQWTGGPSKWIESKRASGKPVELKGGRDSRGKFRKKGATEPAGQTLLDTGQLAASITYSATSSGVTIGSNKVYAAIHQFGGQTGRNKAVTLPARPYNVVQEEDLEEIQAAAEDFFKRVALAAKG